jgi:hypothetical protein
LHLLKDASKGVHELGRTGRQVPDDMNTSRTGALLVCARACSHKGPGIEVVAFNVFPLVCGHVGVDVVLTPSEGLGVEVIRVDHTAFEGSRHGEGADAAKHVPHLLPRCKPFDQQTVLIL